MIIQLLNVLLLFFMHKRSPLMVPTRHRRVARNPKSTNTSIRSTSTKRTKMPQQPVIAPSRLKVAITTRTPPIRRRANTRRIGKIRREIARTAKMKIVAKTPKVKMAK